MAAWQAQQKKDKTAQEAKDLAAAVSDGKTLAAVAAERHLTLTTTPPLARQAQQNAGFPAALIGKLFAAKNGDTVTAEDASGGYVAQLKEVQEPPPPQGDAAKAQDAQLANSIKLDLAGEFTAALRKRYPVEIKRDALDRMF